MLEIDYRDLFRCQLGRTAAVGFEFFAQQLLPRTAARMLAANLIGGYIIGLAVALCSAFSGLSPEWRLFGWHCNGELVQELGARTLTKSRRSRYGRLILEGIYA